MLLGYAAKFDILSREAGYSSGAEVCIAAWGWLSQISAAAGSRGTRAYGEGRAIFSTVVSLSSQQ